MMTFGDVFGYAKMRGYSMHERGKPDFYSEIMLRLAWYKYA